MEIFTVYGKLLLLLVGCMLFSSLVINPFIVSLFIRRNPYPLVWTCLKESGIHAFFTRSSAANIPINMQLCKKFGIDEKFYSVSIPLGSTINMDGAAVTIYTGISKYRKTETNLITQILPINIGEVALVVLVIRIGHIPPECAEVCVEHRILEDVATVGIGKVVSDAASQTFFHSVFGPSFSIIQFQ